MSYGFCWSGGWAWLPGFSGSESCCKSRVQGSRGAYSSLPWGPLHRLLATWRLTSSRSAGLTLVFYKYTAFRISARRSQLPFHATGPALHSALHFGSFQKLQSLVKPILSILYTALPWKAIRGGLDYWAPLLVGGEMYWKKLLAVGVGQICFETWFYLCLTHCANLEKLSYLSEPRSKCAINVWWKRME